MITFAGDGDLLLPPSPSHVRRTPAYREREFF